MMDDDFLDCIVNVLPADRLAGVFVGRVWCDELEGPSVCVLNKDNLIDITDEFPTVRDVCETSVPAEVARQAAQRCLLDEKNNIGKLNDVMRATVSDAAEPNNGDSALDKRLLSPIDLQAVKAAGVTFVVSMIERVIEEKAGGDLSAAKLIRDDIENSIGGLVKDLVPGSKDTQQLKSILVEQGLWSQYLEVGLGPDAEIFTKSQVLSSVGHASEIGIHPSSEWNNPEPEIVLIVSSTGRAVGATLGNDLNLRDIEGRSALLLGKAKDNNASCAIGPFIRLFDTKFTMDQIRSEKVYLKVVGQDGFTLEGSSSMSEISRDPEDLIEQMMGAHHQYPDGAALFLGTMFAPTQDRDFAGQGFTHKFGDVVSIRSEHLGQLVNTVNQSTICAPWDFGVRDLMGNLAQRGVI